MKYKDIIGYKKPKKKLIKEEVKPSEPKVNPIIENIIKTELNEWNDSSFKTLPKRWSKNTYDTGLTEFESTGGKDTLKEVGMSSEIKMYTHAINKNYDRYWDSVKELQKYLAKKGAQKISKQIGSLYTGHVGKFHHWMKTKFIQMVRKMI